MILTGTNVDTLSKQKSAPPNQRRDAPRIAQFVQKKMDPPGSFQSAIIVIVQQKLCLKCRYRDFKLFVL